MTENKPINLDGKDADITFAELCDFCTSDDCPSCRNKFGGDMWLLLGLCSFFGTIGGIAATIVYNLCKCYCMNCWIKLLYGACLGCTLGGSLQYVFFTRCENCCYDTTGSNEPIVQASMYWAAVAAIFQIITTICSCGLGSEVEEN